MIVLKTQVNSLHVFGCSCNVNKQQKFKSVNPSNLQGKYLHSHSLVSEPHHLAVMSTTPAQSFDVAVSFFGRRQIALLQVSQRGIRLGVSKELRK